MKIAHYSDKTGLYMGLIDVKGLLSEMGVEVCATTVSEQAAEIDSLKSELSDTCLKVNNWISLYMSARNERDALRRDGENISAECNRLLGANVDLRKENAQSAAENARLHAQVLELQKTIRSIRDATVGAP